MKSPQNFELASVCTCIPIMISDPANSRKACLIPLAMLVARRTCVCIFTSLALACCSNRSSSCKPRSLFVAALLSSYTTLSATSPRFSFWLRTIMANSSNCGAISGYLTHSRIFSSSRWLLLADSCWLLAFSTICRAAWEVISVLIMQVTSIIITTPFRISSLTR